MKYFLTLLLFLIPLSPFAAPTEIKTTDTLGYSLAGWPVFRDPNKVTIVTFWASWCPFCKKALPVLENLQIKLGKDKVSVIVVNTKEAGSTRETKKTFRKLAKHFEKKSLTAQFIFDKKHQLFKKFDSPGLPYTIIINQTGEVTYSMSGYHESFVQPLLEAVLNEISPDNSAV